MPRRSRVKAIEIAARIVAELPPADRLLVWGLVHGDRTCTVPGCRTAVEASRPFCAAHRKRLYRWGDLRLEVPVRRKRKRFGGAGPL